MFKTLDHSVKQLIINKFDVVAIYCGATKCKPSEGNIAISLEAKFPAKPDMPTFQMQLLKKPDRLLIKKVRVLIWADSEQVDAYSKYMNPIFVLYDLGKDLAGVGGNNWEIKTPADMETFFYKYAHISALYMQPCLFEKLLKL